MKQTASSQSNDTEDALRHTAMDLFFQGIKPIAICRQLGRSRTWHKTLERYHQHGREGPSSHSRSPKRVHNRTSAKVEAAVERVRKTLTSRCSTKPGSWMRKNGLARPFRLPSIPNSSTCGSTTKQIATPGLVWSGSPFRVPAARKGDCLATVLQMETYPALSCIRNIGLLRCQPCAETRHVMRKAYCVASGLSMKRQSHFKRVS